MAEVPIRLHTDKDGQFPRTFHRFSYGGKGVLASEPILTTGHGIGRKMEEKIELSDFERFWNAYPPRKGDRGKTPAKVLFEKAVKSGIQAETIIHGAMQYAKQEAENLNTPYIMQAQRWLRNKRWMDYQFVPQKDVPRSSQVFIREDTPQWRAWQKVKKTPCVNFGWWFPSEWPNE